MGYIYQAALYCDDCGEAIKYRLWNEDRNCPDSVSREVWEEHLGFDDEYAYDSDEYPKYCDETAEADCPQHCDGCSLFLENALTSDGVDYVKAAVREDLESGCIDSVAVNEWMQYYDWIDFPRYGICDNCGAEGWLNCWDECEEECDWTGCSGESYDLACTD